ncbi:MAG: hypothetical protein GY822_05145 [Deltaproteobacteria bacterium]|nr:hypothetical protein [Deltaproteobacteria bacterium]
MGTLKRDEMRTFLADWGHSESEDAAGVTEAELPEVERVQAPRLRWIAETTPNFEAWRERATAAFQAEVGNVPFVTIVRVARQWTTCSSTCSAAAPS